PGYWSRHNTAYWLGKPYLGIGPSAHSYDGRARYWNVAHNPRYVQAIMAGTLPLERELLRPADCYNEYVMVRLRTVWGVRTDELEAMGPQWKDCFLKEVAPFREQGLVAEREGVWRLTRQGKRFADRIAAALFFTD
ncbi:MAG: coproporphyrinogen III oxidase, partial [Alphaproteobacteria bacterium]